MTTQCSCKHYCILLLGILALSSVIGVIAWAISAEVVMGAKREAVRKNDALLRFHAPFESSDDFSITDSNVKIDDSSEILDINPEIDRNEDSRKISANKLIPQSRIYNADEKERKNPYLYDDNDEEEVFEEYEDSGESRHEKASSTLKPVYLSFDLEKIRKTISGSHVADVIDKLVAQRKVLNPKTANSPQIVVVAPAVDSIKKSSTSSTTSTTTLRPFRSSINNSMLSTIRGITFIKPTKATTTESSIRSLISGITTVRPKRTKPKVQTTKSRKSTPTTTPKAIPTTIRPRTKKTVTNKPKATATTAKPTTTRSVTSTAKSRHRGLEYLLDKVEKLEKQHKLFKSKSAESDLLAESSSRENTYKPKNQNQYYPHRQSDQNHDRPEYSYSNFEHHIEPHIESFQQRNPPSYQESSRQFDGRQWLPVRSQADMMPLHAINMHDSHPLPPPPPQPQPQPQPPPQPQLHHQPPPPQPQHMQQTMSSFHTPINPMFTSSNNIPQHQLHAPQQYAPYQQKQHNSALNSISYNQEVPILQNSHLMSAHMLPEHQSEGFHMMPEHQSEGLTNNKFKIKKGFKLGNVFKKFLPLSGRQSSNRAINLNMGGDSFVPHESRPSYQYAVNEGTEDKGVALHFGGGPLGGGGQIMTSPLGIVKTLLLPLMPKPRVNLNGKVVFGVVLENGVGFGKKPKVLAQHYSEGRL